MGCKAMDGGAGRGLCVSNTVFDLGTGYIGKFTL